MQMYAQHGMDALERVPARETSAWFGVGVGLQGEPLQAAQGVPTSEVHLIIYHDSQNAGLSKTSLLCTLITHRTATVMFHAASGSQGFASRQ